MTTHYLATWGCPARLVSQLVVSSADSRPVLLALSWLVAHCGLYEKALRDAVESSAASTSALLPPLPEDTYGSQDSLRAQVLAMAAAQKVVEAALPSSSTSSSGSQWEAVEVAARTAVQVSIGSNCGSGTGSTHTPFFQCFWQAGFFVRILWTYLNNTNVNFN
jgi:hypothetical protein